MDVATSPRRDPAMPRRTYINLPVKDLPSTREFFSGLGFSFDEEFSDETTACVVISDETFAMLHTEPVFQQFTGSDVTDTAHSREVLVGLSADSRQQVDDLVDAAVVAGGQAVGGPVDGGGMYMRAFRDLDGHQWSSIAMEM
jgi:uncharacterized protein